MPSWQPAFLNETSMQPCSLPRLGAVKPTSHTTTDSICATIADGGRVQRCLPQGAWACDSGARRHRQRVPDGRLMVAPNPTIVTTKVPFTVRKRGGRKLVLAPEGSPVPVKRLWD